MSDEESFVILGTSPTSSLDTINSLTIETSASKTVSPINGSLKINGFIDSQLTGLTSSNISQFSVINNSDGAHETPTNGTNGLDNLLKPDSCAIAMAKPIEESSSDSDSVISNSMKKSVISNPSSEGSLAASFILGEVNSDVLKASVYSQFPSICSMGACTEDMVKLQNLMSEYLKLKKTLMTTNLTMKQLYDQTFKWKQDVQAMEDERRSEIAKLRNENLELRRDIEAKVQHVSFNEEIRRKEYDDFVQSLSEKSAQIKNMSTQIQKLEQQQHASFEYIPKNGTETKQEKETTEYVSTLEHQRVIKTIENKMSEIVAENLQLRDMQSHYIDEINCLKVNLVAAEELQKKAQADINLLKANDIEKSDMYTIYENERRSLRADIDVLRHQVEIYSQDYKTVQEAQENLANEKDQLLTDLRELQRKNQELIQEAQRNYEEHARQVMATTGAFPKTRTQTLSCSPRQNNPIYTPTNYNCPLCGKIFKTLSVLQNHVNQCLDGN